MIMAGQTTKQTTATAQVSAPQAAPKAASPSALTAVTSPAPQVNYTQLAEQELNRTMQGFDDDSSSAPANGNPNKNAATRKTASASPPRASAREEESDDTPEDWEQPDDNDWANQAAKQLQAATADDTPEDDDATPQDPDPEADPAQDPELENANDEDPEAPPAARKNGLDAFPKAAADRIKQLSRIKNEQRDLLAQRPAFIADPALPLSHCLTTEALEQEISNAEADLDRFSSLTDDDFTRNAKGEVVFSYRYGGKTYELTADQVQERLKLAEARLDRKALLKQREFIDIRNRDKPWQAAEAILPDIFTPGTIASNMFEALLEQVPELKARQPHHEVILANAIAHHLQSMEQQPTKEYPHGRFKWVKLELDQNGKPKVARPSSPARGTNATPAPARRAPTRGPGNQMPNLSASRQPGSRQDFARAQAKVDRNNPDSVKELVSAAFAGL